MKTLTQTEIDLLVKILGDAVCASKWFFHTSKPYSVRLVGEAEHALEIAKRLKPVEVLQKAKYHDLKSVGDDYEIFSDSQHTDGKDCVDVLIIKESK